MKLTHFNEILRFLLLVVLLLPGCVQTGNEKETASVIVPELSKEEEEKQIEIAFQKKMKTLFCPETERELWFMAEVLRNDALPLTFIVKKNKMGL